MVSPQPPPQGRELVGMSLQFLLNLAGSHYFTTRNALLDLVPLLRKDTRAVVLVIRVA